MVFSQLRSPNLQTRRSRDSSLPFWEGGGCATLGGTPTAFLCSSFSRKDTLGPFAAISIEKVSRGCFSTPFDSCTYTPSPPPSFPRRVGARHLFRVSFRCHFHFVGLSPFPLLRITDSTATRSRRFSFLVLRLSNREVPFFRFLSTKHAARGGLPLFPAPVENAVLPQDPFLAQSSTVLFLPSGSCV